MLKKMVGKRMLPLFMSAAIALSFMPMGSNLGIGAEVAYAAELPTAVQTDHGVTWQITAEGTLIIGEDGQTQNLYVKDGEVLTNADWAWNAYRKQIKEVSFAGDINASGSLSKMFCEMSSLTKINDLSRLKTSGCTSASYMFFHCEALETLDISGFDSSKITSTRCMFDTAKNLKTLKLKRDDGTTDFTTPNLIDMRNMFFGCESLEEIDITGMSTAKVKAMSRAFQACKSLKKIDLTNFDISSVENSYPDASYEYQGLNRLFNECFSLEEIVGLDKLNTSKIEDFTYMFGSCKSLAKLDLRNFDTSSATSLYGMFIKNNSLTELDLTKFKTGNVKTMMLMFKECPNLSKITGLENFDTSSVENMQEMFYNTGLQTIDVSNFDTRNVTTMHKMFSENKKAEEIIGLETFDTGKVTDMRYMFSGCSKLNELNLASFDTSNVKDMYGMFNATSNLRSVDVSGFDTSKATDMSQMFRKSKVSDPSMLSMNMDTLPTWGAEQIFAECKELAKDLKKQIGAGNVDLYPADVKKMIEDAVVLIDTIVAGEGALTVNDVKNMIQATNAAKIKINEVLPDILSDAEKKAADAKAAAEEAEKKTPGSNEALKAAQESKEAAEKAAKLAEAQKEILDAKQKEAEQEFTNAEKALSAAEKKLKRAKDRLKELENSGTATTEEIDTANAEVSAAQSKYDAININRLPKATNALKEAKAAAQKAADKLLEKQNALKSANDFYVKVEKENKGGNVESPVKKGNTYTVSSNSYKVTKVATTKANGTVIFVKAKNAKSISVPKTVKLIDGKAYVVNVIGAKAFTAKKIRKVTVGANVSKLNKNAFAKSKTTTIVLKTKKLTKKSVKGSLKGSKVKTVKVKVGNKKMNAKYVKKYKKIFTKKNAGKKVSVKK